MRENRLHAVWADKGYALNAWLSIGSSYSAEVIASLPYDAVTVDLQHGMFDFDTALTMLQAISTTAAVPLVRVSHNSAWMIQKLLDMGAYGVICPMIDTRRECEAFVKAMRYPPRGDRSFGPSRGLLYGGTDYAAHADRTVLAWGMIETEVAVGNLAEILSVEGLDGVYIGPSDLSMTIEGKVSNPLSSRVVSVVDGIIDAAHRAGKRVGIFCPDAAFARQMIERGCDLVTVMNDAGLVRQATGTLLKELAVARHGSNASTSGSARETAVG